MLTVRDGELKKLADSSTEQLYEQKMLMQGDADRQLERKQEELNEAIQNLANVKENLGQKVFDSEKQMNYFKEELEKIKEKTGGLF